MGDFAMNQSSARSVPVRRNNRPAGSALKAMALCLALLGAGIVADAVEPQDIAAQLRTATALHQRADYAHSIPLLKLIVQKSPRNYMANLLLGIDLMRSGSVQQALAPLKLAATVRPDDGAPQAYLAQAGTALGDFAMAAEALQSAVTASGGEEQYLMAWANYCVDRFRFLGMSLSQTKQGEAAELRMEAWIHPLGDQARESLLEQAAAADPDHPGLWGELGAAQLESHEPAKAAESLKQAEARNPRGAETLRLEALLAAGEGKWPEAEKHLLILGAHSPSELARVLGLWPARLLPAPSVAGAVWDCLRNSKAPCPLVAAQPQGGEGLSAKDLYAEGRWEQLKALPQAAPGNDQELFRGVALARTGDCPHAISTLERELNADLLTASFWLQFCYANEELRTDGRLSAAGNQVGLHELRGDVALRLRYDAATAQKEYTAALKSRPKDPRLLARLAEAASTAGDTAHARSAAQAALAADPRQSSALRTLAAIALDQRDYAEALGRLKQLAVLQPKDPWVQAELGVVSGQLGQPAEAVRYLQPLLAAGYPDKKGALHAQLAGALRKLGRDDEARQAAAEASRLANLSMEVHPGSADAHQ
jgi:tetratricopeptide (TPR) repeat protein